MGTICCTEIDPNSAKSCSSSKIQNDHPRANCLISEERRRAFHDNQILESCKTLDEISQS
jgi:hypothetical protein